MASASDLFGGSGGNVEIINGSGYTPDFRLPLFLRKDSNSANDFSSTGNFTFGTGYHNFRNFTINASHQMTLSAGLTIINCSETFTCGGNGITGVTGTLINLADNYTLQTAGSVGTGGTAGANIVLRD